jgi:hypothetical protein
MRILNKLPGCWPSAMALAALLWAAAGSRGDQISFEYNFLTPAAVTGDAGNLGAISFATTVAGHIGSADTTVTAATLAAATSAPSTTPDTFHGQSYNLTLELTDDASGQSGTLTFTGKLFGTLSAQSASITTSFDSSTKTLILGADRYLVTIGPFTSSSNPTIPGTLQASIEVTPFLPAEQAPEPPTILLAGIGLCAVRFRRRRSWYQLASNHGRTWWIQAKP